MLKLHIKSLPETEVSQWEYICIYTGLKARTEGQTYQFDYCREKLHKNPRKVTKYCGSSSQTKTKMTRMRVVISSLTMHQITTFMMSGIDQLPLLPTDFIRTQQQVQSIYCYLCICSKVRETIICILSLCFVSASNGKTQS